jgi:multidrug efflux pump subunit AcrA (membrane-fusion protein)
VFRLRAQAEYVNADTRGSLLAIAPPATRWLLAAATIVLVTGFGVAAFGRVRVSAEGRGEVKPSEKLMPVVAPAHAQVKAVRVAPGDAVKRGDVLVELDTSMAAREMATCAARLDRLRQARDGAQRQLDAQQLRANPDETMTLLVQQRVLLGDEALAKAQAECDKLGAQMASAQVTSPIDGTAVEVNAQPQAPAKEGAVLVTVLPTSAKPRAFAHVAESEIGRIEPGELVYLQLDAYPYESYGPAQGRVVRVLDGLAEAAHKHTEDEDLHKVVEIELVDTPAGVKVQPGMRFSASIVTRETSVASIVFPR